MKTSFAAHRGPTAIAILAIASITCGCSQKTEIQTSKQQHTQQEPEQLESAETTQVASATTEAVTRPELNWADFPFMKPNDSVVAVMSPAKLAKSPSISKLIAALPLEDISLTIPPSETEWVAVYTNPLVNADNSLTGEATMVIKLNRPSSTFEIAESRYSNAELKEVSTDDHSYLRVSGLTENTIETTSDAEGNSSEVVNFDTAAEMAVYEYDAYTYVVCEEARLPYVLSQEEETVGDLRTLVTGTESTSPLFFASSIKDRTILKEALAIQAADIQEGGMLQILATNTDQIILSLDTDNEQLLQMSVQTTDAGQATEIEQAIMALVESGSQFVAEMKAFENPQTASIFALARSILSGVAVTSKDAHVQVTVTNPGNLPEAFSTLQTLFGMEVTAASVR